MKSQADLRSGHGGWLAVTVSLGGAPRSIALRGWASTSIAVAGAVLAAWSLGATLYFLFHDELLAGLMARQAAAQYAYEDRIAGLSMQLDQQTSRALMDRRTLETSVRDLRERSARLAARAALIDRLVTHQAAPAGPAPDASAARARISAAASRNPLLDSRVAPLGDAGAYAEAEPARSAAGLGFDAVPLRLGEGAASGEISGAAGDEAEVTSALSSAEQDQDHALDALRDPALRLVAKLKAALAAVGVGTAGVGKDVGGPYVPLPASAVTFEGNAALVEDAFIQADQLTALADKVPLRQPIGGALEVTSSFGARLDPFLGRPAMHTGIDFREGYGAEVRATAAGSVTTAAPEGGYGTMVEVNHGDGLVTRYAHLARANVAPGQRVETGTIIGQVGSSGRATGPHLHYETRVNGEPVDPSRFLRAGAKLFGAS